MTAVVVEAKEEQVREQYLSHLTIANQVRIDRARMKQQLRKGELSHVRVLLDLPPCMAGMTVYQFLTTYRRVGVSKAGKTLNGLRISPNRSLRTLTDRQRHELAGVIQGWGRSTEHGSSPEGEME